MKQLIYETKKGTILFVKIEKSYSLAGLNDGHIYFWTSTLSQAMNDYPLCFEIPKGDFELIGLTSEVTEEQAKMMVDIVKPHGAKGTYFKEYNNIRPFYATTIQSFKSLMQHLQVYEVNPLGEDFEGDLNTNEWVRQAEIEKKWNEANETVGKWIVLFKPNEKL